MKSQYLQGIKTEIKFSKCNHAQLREYCVYKSDLECNCIICGQTTNCVDECFLYPVCSPKCQREMTRKFIRTFKPVQGRRE